MVVTLKDSSAEDYPDKGEESERDLLRPRSAKEEKEGETTGTEQRMMKLTLGITGTGKGGEDYSIPLNVSRPRSGSGSRYLTDRVRHIIMLCFFYCHVCCISFSITYVVIFSVTYVVVFSATYRSRI